VQLKEKDIENC